VVSIHPSNVFFPFDYLCLSFYHTLFILLVYHNWCQQFFPPFAAVFFSPGLCAYARAGIFFASFCPLFHIFLLFIHCGARGSAVVKALCYKPEGRGSIPDEVNF
jgi:hypothetical protein